MNWKQIENWVTHPETQYIPMNRVQFAPYQPVAPYELPPIGAHFTQPQFNKILNIPSMQQIYHGPRRPFG